MTLQWTDSSVSKEAPVSEGMDLLGVPLARARTLPGHWYADPQHHERELARHLPARLGRRRQRRGRGRARLVRRGCRPAACRSLVTRDDRRCAAGVRQRVPPPWLAAGRRLWPRRGRCRARTTPGCTGSTARWRAPVASGSRRASTRRPRTAPGAGDDVRPVVAGQRRSRARPVRPRPAGRGPGALPARRPRARRAHAGTSATSTGRSCSRTTARTTTRPSSTRSCRPAATSTRSSAPGRP